MADYGFEIMIGIPPRQPVGLVKNDKVRVHAWLGEGGSIVLRSLRIAIGVLIVESSGILTVEGALISSVSTS